jgi:drug/metabolite transporter (DMT)-like permease
MTHPKYNEKTIGFMACLFAMLLWTAGNLCIRYLTNYYHALEQNFIRIGLASIVLLGWVIGFRKQEFIKALKDWKIFILPILILFAAQILWVTALKKMLPGFAMLISKLDTVFATILACVLFKDERSTVLNKGFLGGMLLSITGCIGIIIFNQNFVAELNVYIFLTILSALLFGAYSVFLKKPADKYSPDVCHSIIMTGAAFCFLIVELVHPDLRLANLMPQSGTLVIFIVIGVLSVGLGNLFYTKSIATIGVSTATNVFLLMPLMVLIASYFVYGEVLSLRQWAMVPLLLAGCWFIVLSTKRRKKTQPPM